MSARGWLVGIALVLAPVAGAAAAPARHSYAEDRAEIQDLMARYLFALDWSDADAYAATFTPDGEIVWARGTVKGRAALAGLAADFHKQMVARYGGPGVTLRHFITHSAITVKGDHAYAVSAWFEMDSAGPNNSARMGTFGTYRDELVRSDGHWRFTRREVFNEFLAGRHSPDSDPATSPEMMP